MTAEPQLLFTPRQASEALAISPRKLWSITAAGEIPHLRLGRCVRYPVSGLNRWVDQQLEGSADASRAQDAQEVSHG